jgi:hypothetical protein
MTDNTDNTDTIDNTETKHNTNIDEKIINQITLECLINKEMYKKYLTSNNVNTSINNKKDRKFYRKRILQLTRDILLNDPSVKVTSDIKFVFENYVNHCIQYFKMVDRVDLIQEDYYIEDYKTVDNVKTVEDVKDDDVDNIDGVDNEKTSESADKLLLRSVKINNYTLDKFVKVISTKKVDSTPLPVQKIFNLKDPNLRNKGIRKKKNIDTKYEEPIEKTNESVQNDEKK